MSNNTYIIIYARIIKKRRAKRNDAVSLWVNTRAHIPREAQEEKNEGNQRGDAIVHIILLYTLGYPSRPRYK